MEKDTADFSKLDDELCNILFSESYGSIRRIWKKVSVSHSDILWNRFLLPYCGVSKNGIFDKDGKLEANAENEFNLWIERNLPRVEKILKE